jgi:hypothetical protein
MTAFGARARRKREEDQIQRSILAYLAQVLPQPYLCFHIPNGGYRAPAEARILKGLGVVAGVPDFCLLMPGGRAFFIEVKAEAGALEDSQEAITTLFIRMAQPYCVARSIDDVRKALTHWKIATKEAKPCP